MFQSPMRSSSGSCLFISLLMLLILKTIKIFKNFKKVLLIRRGYVAAYV